MDRIDGIPSQYNYHHDRDDSDEANHDPPPTNIPRVNLLRHLSATALRNSS